MSTATGSRKFRLEGKSAIITGGASGIGSAISTAFADAGATVHILDLDGAAASATSSALLSAGAKAFAHTCNVADQAHVDDVFSTLLARQPIDILVNNAGVSSIGTVASTSPQEFQKILDINVNSVYYCTRAVIGHMVERGRGVILNMASVAATAGLAERFAYSTSKGAVRAMTISIAIDFVKQGIRCNCISPARVHTGFVDGYLAKNYPGREGEMFEKLSAAQPIGRMAKPAEIADLALYLCSDEAAFVTGTDYPIDGGFFNLHN